MLTAGRFSMASTLRTRLPVGVSLHSYDEPKLLRRGDTSSHLPIVKHARVDMATSTTTIITADGFCALRPEEVANHPQHLSFIEVDRAVLTLCAPQTLGAWLISHQSVVDKEKHERQQEIDGHKRHERQQEACTEASGPPVVVHLGAGRVLLAAPDLIMEELESFIMCAEHVSGVKPSLHRPTLIRHGQKAMRIIHRLHATRVLEIIQAAVARDPSEAVELLVNQGIFRCRPTYRVHLLESRTFDGKPAPAKHFVTDVHAVRARSVAVGAPKPINVHGNLDAAETSDSMREGQEFIMRSVWDTNMPSRAKMHAAGSMALLRAMARADETGLDGEPVGPCAYLTPQLKGSWGEREAYLASAAQCRSLADFVEEERLMESARQLAVVLETQGETGSGSSVGTGVPAKDGPRFASSRNTTQLYWRAKAASSGLGMSGMRDTPRKREENLMQRRLTELSAGRHILDGDGGGVHHPWWPDDYARAVQVAKAQARMWSTEETQKTGRCNKSVRLAERRMQHSTAMRREIGRCKAIVTSTALRTACIPQALPIPPPEPELESEPLAAVDILDVVDMAPTNKATTQQVATQQDTPQRWRVHESVNGLWRRNDCTHDLAIPPLGVGLPRECEIDPYEMGRRAAGFEWKTAFRPDEESNTSSRWARGRDKRHGYYAHGRGTKSRAAAHQVVVV